MTDSTPDGELGVERSCFVISPIGSRLAPIGTPARASYEQNIQVWERVIEPACAHFGLTPLRSDKISEPGEITEQIFTLLRDSDVVIADLTDGNANVMYELGLRHTRDKITVQIGEYQRLPFDVNTIRTLQFTRTEAGFIDVRESLIESLRAALAGRSTPVTATRVWTEGAVITSAEISEVAARSSSPDDDAGHDEPGFIDILAEGEESVTSFGERLDEITSRIADIANVIDESTAAIHESDQRQGGFAGRLTVARQTNENLKPPAEELQKLAIEFRKDVSTADAALNYMLDRMTEDTDERAEGAEFLQVLADLGVVVAESESSTAEFAQHARGLANISRVLKDSSRTMTTAMNDILWGMGTMKAWAERARRLLDDGRA